MENYAVLMKRLQNGNDVRGAAIACGDEAKTLTPGLVSFIAYAFAEYLAGKTGKAKEDLRIGVGHDSRVTAEELKKACLFGLSDCASYDCGLISTPAMFQSTVLPESHFDGSIMLTASHLPFNRNGMKFFTRDGGLEKQPLTEILERAAELAAEYGTEDEEEFVRADRLPAAGRKAEPFDMVSIYADAMKKVIKEAVQGDDYEHPLKGLHIIVDAGNGASGFFASSILAPLGADTSGSVFLDPDGTFPNHIPNPENAAAMEAARKATLDAGADLGVIFDCDGDRGAVVFSDGTEVNRNTLIALLAAIVSESAPGTTDSSSSLARMAPALRGRKPSKKKCSMGRPEATSAQMAADGPGMTSTRSPLSSAASTSLWPGSETPGMPASETKATRSPASMRSSVGSTLWSSTFSSARCNGTCTSKRARSLLVTRVSSQSRRSADFRVWMTLGDASERFPMGVPTTLSTPEAAALTPASFARRMRGRSSRPSSKACRRSSTSDRTTRRSP